MGHVTAVIFDWAGTTVDYGSVAPVRTLQKLFAARGIEVSEAEARRDMGIHKKDHIRALLRAKTGGPPDEALVAEFFAEFIPMQMDCLVSYSDVIEGVAETVAKLRVQGIKIGSTTGYTRPMLDVLAAHAATQGYIPECALCPEDTIGGRPLPWMCYLNAIRLGTYPMHTMVKVGDTVSDIEEGRNAGMWTVGVTQTGNMMGQSRPLLDAGAHVVIDRVGDLNLDAIEERLARGERP
jgi:phosphonoacetaldehyde hydrolase